MSILNPTCCVCGNKAGITAVANADTIKMLCPECRNKITKMGFNYRFCKTDKCKEIVENYDKNHIKELDLSDCYSNHVITDSYKKIIKDVVNESKILVFLIGAFKEYLICTDKQVYIVKKGIMTGHTFGKGIFHMPYANITNAEVNTHLLTGYFELSSGGLQNKDLSYWSTDKNTDPSKLPNCIAISGSSAIKSSFEEAARIIMNKVNEIHISNNFPNNSTINSKEKSIADEIREFKLLMDEGIISQEEFNKKKEELLNL